MPSYSDASLEKLRTAHHDLVKVFFEVVNGFDNTILYGHRSKQLQFELYQKGRKYVEGAWVIDDKSKVVTYINGYSQLSDHNYEPSRAIDSVAYPIDWDDKEKHIEFGGYVLGVANMLFAAGEIGHKIGWSWHWKKKFDLFHFYLLSE